MGKAESVLDAFEVGWSYVGRLDFEDLNWSKQERLAVACRVVAALQCWALIVICHGCVCVAGRHAGLSPGSLSRPLVRSGCRPALFRCVVGNHGYILFDVFIVHSLALGCRPIAVQSQRSLGG